MKKLKILMATAEMAPFAKVGGLADVIGSLPMALKKNNCDVRVIMPLYGSIDHNKYGLQKKYENIVVPFGGKKTKVNIWQTNWKSITIYFIEYPKYFSQKEIYQGGTNTERYLFFSQAVLCSLETIKFIPDCLHCHDYHTAMIPFLLKSSGFDNLRSIKTILTIHNLQYQGKASTSLLDLVDLKIDNTVEIDFMEQGIILADMVTTVSPTYSREIMTKEFGEGLEILLKKNKRKVVGVLNGIDMDFFNPAKDKLIAKKFSIANLAGKMMNKRELQKFVGLPVIDKPLIGLVSRFVEQKGLELITEEIAKLDCQFVFLGTGSEYYENFLRGLSQKYPQKISAQIKFDIRLAQLVYAGADIFLMPSRFEPCGLGQMIAMRYGTVPVVRAVGGLADTVFECDVISDDYRMNGFVFRSMTTKAMMSAIKKSLAMYNDKKVWQKIQNNGMTGDFSWDNSAKKYIELYQKLDS